MSKVLSFWNQTITRIRPGIRTARGQDIPNWDNANELVIDNCSVQPNATTLSQDGRVLGISQGLTVYAPADADILAGDRIKYQNNDYTIDGELQRWPSPTGRLEHIRFNIVRWQG